MTGSQEFDWVADWRITYFSSAGKVLEAHAFTGTRGEAIREARKRHPNGPNGKYEMRAT